MPFVNDDADSRPTLSSPATPPNISASSVGGAPRSTSKTNADVFGSMEGGFLPEDKGDPITESDVPSLAASGYKLTNEDYRNLYAQKQAEDSKKTFLDKVGTGIEGVLSPIFNAPGEIFHALGPGETAGTRVARTSASVPEGLVGAAQNLTSLVTGPVEGAYHALTDTPESKYQRWYFDYMAQHPEATVSGANYPTGLTPDWMRGGFAPLPNTSQALSTLGTFALPEAAGTGAARIASIPALQPLVEAGETAKMIPGIAARNIYEATGAHNVVPIGTLSEAFPRVQNAVRSAVEKVTPAPGAAGRAVSAVGSGLNYLGGLPEKAIEAVTSKLLSPEIAEELSKVSIGPVKAGEAALAGAGHVLGLPIHETLGAIKGAQGLGTVIKGLGDYMERLAQADPASPFGRLYSVASDSTAPSWMRALSDFWGTKAAAGVVQAGGNVAKGAVEGALFGAGYGLLPGQDLANSIGTGIGFGTIGGGLYSGRMNDRARLQAHMQDIDNLAQSHLNEGISPETLKHVSTPAMGWASVIQRITGVPVRFVTEADGAIHGTLEGQAGMHDLSNPQHPRILIDPTKRDAEATVLHEAFHPIYDQFVRSHPEIADTINQVLQSQGQDINGVKAQYAKALLGKKTLDGMTPEQQTAKINEVIAGKDAQSQSITGDPNSWAHAEFMAEAATQSLYGKNPINDVLKDSVLQPITDLVQNLNVKLNPGRRPGTVLPDFSGALTSPALRKLTYSLLREQKGYFAGFHRPLEEKGVQATADKVGKHPAFPAKQDSGLFKEVAPGKFELLPSRTQRKIQRSRQQRMNSLYPTNVEPVEDGPGVITMRRTPSGLVQRRGTELGPDFYNDDSFGESTKQAARMIEQSIKDGIPLKGWNQVIGKAGQDFKESVATHLGNVSAQFKNQFYPTGFVLSKAGNVLVEGYDLGGGFDSKAARWAEKTGDVSLNLWGNDQAKFKDDAKQYLKNHALGLPGEDNGIGLEKKKVLDAFFVGKNKTFEKANELRAKLGKEDREGLVRQYRLDRLETLEPDAKEFDKPDYKKQLYNMSPPVGSEISVTDKDGKEYKARFDGYQDFTVLGAGKMAQITALEDIPGVASKHSTTYSASLKRKGYVLPELGETPASKKFSPAVERKAKTFVIRHGETDFNDPDTDGGERIRGWNDGPKAQLTEDGRKQAAKTAENLVGKGIHTIVSSDLGRAMETAHIIGDKIGANVVPDAGLRPWNLGDMTGKLVSEVQPKMEQFIKNPDVPIRNGESFNEFKNRFLDSYRRINEENPGNVGVVTHFRGTKLLDAWKHNGGVGNDIDMERFLSDKGGKDTAGHEALAKPTKLIGGVYSPVPFDTSKEHIITAALKMGDGNIFTGGAHAWAAMNAENAGYTGEHFAQAQDGFMTSEGRFVNREEAKKLAMASGQIDIKKAKEVDTQFHLKPEEKTASSMTPLESVTFNASRRFSPEVEKQLSKMPGARADELPDGPDDNGNFWMTKDGKFISVAQHQQLADQLAPELEHGSIYDLYKYGLRRVVVGNAREGGKEVFVNSAQYDSNLSPKQQQAVETLKDRGFAVRGDVGKMFSPALEEKQGRLNINSTVRKNAKDYMDEAGIKNEPHTGLTPLSEELSKKAADEYDAATHNPSDPKVQAAYKALRDETLAQWNFLKDRGVDFEPYTEAGQPYANSKEMMEDVRKNQHLYYFPTASGFGLGGKDLSDHPMLEDLRTSPDNPPLLLNDIFRAVHDYFGHAKEGYEFGPRGEYNAFLAHSKMFSDAALPALAAETMGQNSWVNYGPHMRNAEGNVPKKGEPGFVPLEQRRYADQKATTLQNFSPSVAEKDDWKLKAGDQSGIAHVWLTPEGKPIQLGGQWHHEWLAANPDVRKKYGLPEHLKTNPMLTKAGEDARVPALRKGFVRINYSINRGELTVELRRKDIEDQAPAIIQFVKQNAGKIDSITVHTFDNRAKAVTDSSTSRVLEVPNEEKVNHIPFISTPSETVEMSAQARSQFSPAVPAFKQWAGSAPVKEEGADLRDIPSGKPVVITGYHGTTHDFSIFDPSKASPENDWGKGIYITTESADVKHNYAGKGPDLKMRIERRAEQIFSENNVSMDTARKKAAKELMSHKGATMKLYVKLENPFKVGGKGEEMWTTDYPIIKEAGEDVHDYDHPSGTMGKFTQALKEAASNFHDIDEDALANLVEELNMRGGSGESSYRVISMVKHSDAIANATDDEGNLVSSEVLRQTLEKMGYDGIIDATVDKKFGSGSGRMKPMKGMNPSTVHVIAFKPESVKSATGNRGEYNPQNPDIRYSPGVDDFRRIAQELSKTLGRPVSLIDVAAAFQHYGSQPKSSAKQDQGAE